MPQFSLARNLLANGVRALCLYTKGKHLRINSGDCTGASGWWILDKNKHYDIIILFMPSSGESATHEIHIARHDGFSVSRNDGKCEILLSGISFAAGV